MLPAATGTAKKCAFMQAAPATLICQRSRSLPGILQKNQLPTCGWFAGEMQGRPKIIHVCNPSAQVAVIARGFATGRVPGTPPFGVGL
jgi:hypothetical protein